MLPPTRLQLGSRVPGACHEPQEGAEPFVEERLPFLVRVMGPDETNRASGCVFDALVNAHADAVSCSVIKMNIDTDTQYAYTQPVVGHMFKNSMSY